MLLALPATLIAVPVLLRNPAVGLALALGLALVPGVGGALATLAREVGALFSPARHTPRRLRAPRGAGAAPVDWRHRPDATPLPAPRARTLPPAGRAASEPRAGLAPRGVRLLCRGPRAGPAGPAGKNRGTTWARTTAPRNDAPCTATCSAFHRRAVAPACFPSVSHVRQ
jgi:hypothetical protein